MMNRPLVFLVAMAGLATFPVHGQWCEAIPDPFPADPPIEWDTKAEGVPVIEVLAMVLPEAGTPESVRPRGTTPAGRARCRSRDPHRP